MYRIEFHPRDYWLNELAGDYGFLQQKAVELAKQIYMSDKHFMCYKQSLKFPAFHVCIYGMIE